METVGNWGNYILVRQVFLAGIAYAISVAYRGVDTFAFLFALVAAGIVAVVTTVTAMVSEKTIGVAVSLSSLSIVLAAFSVMSSAGIFAGIFSFLALTLAMLAAMLARHDGLMANEPFFLVVISAVPVIGSVCSFFVRWTSKGRA